MADLKAWTVIKVAYRGDKKDLRKKAEIRPAAILTDSYVASGEVDISGFSLVAGYFAVTQGSLTSFQYKVEQSIDDGVTWHPISADDISASVITDTSPSYNRVLSGDANWYKVFYATGQRFRVQVKGTGTMTGSSCTVYAVGVY